MVDRWTRLTGGLIAVTGGALSLFLLGNALESTSRVYWLVESYPIALSLLLVGNGLLLARGHLIEDRFLGRLLGWTVIGVLALSLLAAYLFVLAIVFADNELLSTPVGIVTILVFGALVGLLVGVYDARAMERKRAAERREEKLATHNERLDEFASVVSHDLRNPLNVILGRVKLARADGKREHLDAIAQAGDRMQVILEDLLSLSRAGRTIDAWEPVTLAAVAEESWANVPTADSELELRVPDGTTVRADRDRLRNVFENIYRNATEHNEAPVGVRVGVLESTAVSAECDSVAGFSLEDDGDGIAPDRRETVFDHEYTSKSDGTGLGLSIVEEIVEAHDWTVSVTAGDRGGARFEIRTSARPRGS